MGWHLKACDSSILDDVFTNERKVFEVGVDPTSMPTMPVEFSIAAYRLGHSMVRSAYHWKKDFEQPLRNARLPVRVHRPVRRPGRVAAPDKPWVGRWHKATVLKGMQGTRSPQRHGDQWGCNFGEGPLMEVVSAPIAPSSRERPPAEVR